MYGKECARPAPQECGVQAGLYRKDRSLFRQRLTDALEQLKKIPGCHPNQLAAIGYCFGGTGVLELARSGADLRGVVSFHGGLDSPTPEDGAHIRSKVLVLHGAEDPFVSQENLQAFVQEMRQWQVDWQMIQWWCGPFFHQEGGWRERCQRLSLSPSGRQTQLGSHEGFLQGNLSSCRGGMVIAF